MRSDTLTAALQCCFALASVAAEVLPAPSATPPRPGDRETVWSKWIAEELGAEAEHRCFDGSRVDVLTDTHAVEVEWASKWEQAIGQAVWYAEVTSREPAVIVLAGPGDTDDAIRCLHVGRLLGVPVAVVLTEAADLLHARRVLQIPTPAKGR